MLTFQVKLFLGVVIGVLVGTAVAFVVGPVSFDSWSLAGATIPTSAVAMTAEAPDEALQQVPHPGEDEIPADGCGCRCRWATGARSEST